MIAVGAAAEIVVSEGNWKRGQAMLRDVVGAMVDGCSCPTTCVVAVPFASQKNIAGFDMHWLIF